MLRFAVFAILCFCHAQANIENDFDELKNKIEKANEKTLNEFIEFGTALSQDYTDLSNKVNEIHNELFELTISPHHNHLPCTKILQQSFEDLEKSLEQTIESHLEAQSILSWYYEFISLLETSKKDVLQMQVAFDGCGDDDECKSGVRKSMAEKVEEDEVAKNARKITENISAAYPAVEVVIKKYRAWIDEIEKELQACKLS